MEKSVYICNECCNEISDVRYHCSECSDFDLCQSCYDKKIHTEHYMSRDTCGVRPITILDSCSNLQEFLENAFSLYSTRLFLGKRMILPGGEIDNEYCWLTYKEVGDVVLRVYSALVGKLSIPPKSTMSVCSKNYINWFVADFAILYSGCIAGNIHCELSKESIVEIINTAETICVFCDKERTQTFLDILSSKECPSLKYVVLLDDNLPPAGEAYDPSSVYALSDLERIGKKSLIPKPVYSPPTDVADVIFTSGSTGRPKGVPSSHMSYLRYFRSKLTSGRLNAYLTIYNGGRIGFLTRPDTRFEDLRILGPSYISEVPRFYEVLYSEYQKLWAERRAKFIEENPSYLPQDLDAERKEVLACVRGYLGTRVELLLCGGAALSTEVSNFVKDCWAKVLFREGYGTTEAGQIANDEGVIYNNVQYKIIDCPDMGYTAADFPYPRGELLVKTPQTEGKFFNNSEETARSYDEDGFFRTGDIVELIAPGTIRIIDRKKSIFKLSQGEFVSPSKIENAIVESRFVESAFVTYGTVAGSKKIIVAVVVVSEEALRKEAPRELCGSGIEELCADKSVNGIVFGDIIKVCGDAKLRPFEIPLAVLLDWGKWTPENGLLTQSSKNNRTALEKKYKDAVQKLAEATNESGSNIKSDDIAETVAKILGIPPSDVNKDNIVETFLRSGGDSMSAIRLSSTLNAKFCMEMKPADLFNESAGPVQKFMSLKNKGTISSSSSITANDRQRLLQLQTDMCNDSSAAALLEGLTPRPSAMCVFGNSRHVFLTGATGFIGVHILEYLFNVEGAHVYCLVRCKDEASGVKKLLGVMSKFHITFKEDHEKKFCKLVKVIPGDLAADDEHLGISDEDMDLISSIDNLTFIHCGAYVNHVLPYNILKKTNVDGTKKILRIALNCPNSVFTYISTISVMMGTGIMPLSYLVQSAGYPQSKWVAENVVKEFCSRTNMPYNIVRPGMTSWSSKTGVLTETDWFSRLIRGLSYVRAAPYSSSTFSIVPVDFMAETIAKIALRKFEIMKPDYNVFDFPPLYFQGLLKLLSMVANTILKDPSALEGGTLFDGTRVQDLRFVDGFKGIAEPVSQAVWNDVVTSKLSAVERGSRDEEILSGLRMFYNGLPNEGSKFSPSHEISCPVEYPSISREYIAVMLKNNSL